MKCFFSVYFMLLSVFCVCQGQQKHISKGESVASLILYHVNQIRDSLGLPILSTDQELVKAAKMQSKYCSRLGKLTHYQKKDRYKTVKNRVVHLGGVHQVVGENVLRRTLKINESLEDLANEIVNQWIRSPGHYANMISDIYQVSGVSVVFNKRSNSVYATQVFGSTPLSFDGFKSPAHSYYITKSKTKTKECKACLKALDTIYNFGLIVSGRSVLLSMSDVKHFNEVFGESIFAADIILRRQFECGKPNIYHGSSIHDGYLSEPVTARKVINDNVMTDGSLLSEIAVLPFELNEQYEANLVLSQGSFLSKKKNHCVNIVPSAVYGYDLKMLPHTLLVETSSDENSFLFRRILEFKVPFEKDKYVYNESDVKPIIDSIFLDKFDIKEVKIYAFASVEGSKEHNKELQIKRAKSIIDALQTYQTKSIRRRVITNENWREFKRDLKKSPYSYLLKLSKDSIKVLLGEDELRNNLEPILSRHRKAVIKIKAIEKIDSTISPAMRLEEYENALKDSTISIKKLARLQGLVYALVLREELDLREVKGLKLPLESRLAELWVNRVALIYLLDGTKPEIEDLFVLDSLASKSPKALFDIHGLMIEHGYNNPLIELPRERILANLIYLRNKKNISAGAYYKMMLNYHLATANYFKYRNENENERNSVDYVFNHYYKATLTPHDALVLANFLVYHGEVKRATKLLKPYAGRDEVTDDLLFYYLSISFLQESIEKNEDFQLKMQEALSRDKERFCKLFGYPAISFQMLRNNVLKSYYCEFCNEKLEADAKSIIGDEDLSPHLIDIDNLSD